MKLALVMGTRPEVIKMAGLAHALEASRDFESLIISTGQHREMIDPLFDWFGFRPDVDLHLMRPGQTPQGLLARALSAMDDCLAETKPDVVLVQGDTSTALAGALAAFHRQIPVGHVEAGLRTGDMYSPFPEEMNRLLIGRIATWNFAPTKRSADALLSEKAGGRTEVVGNTVVDALRWTAAKLPAVEPAQRRLVLVTAHRRESFGDAMAEALGAIAELARSYPDVDFVYPVHRNPNVLALAHRLLGDIANMRLIEPVDYPEMVDLMRRSYLILSDSGGVQEEAPSFGVPILVMRENTERPEVVEAGVGELVGTSRERILARARHFLDDLQARALIAAIPNPFGDGRTSQRILSIVGEAQQAPESLRARL